MAPRALIPSPVWPGGLRMPWCCSTANFRSKRSSVAPFRWLRPSATAEALFPATCAAAVAPFTLSRSIENLRPRLDPAPLKPRPSDLDPTIQIGAYPFALAYLLKRPWDLSDSTRDPPLFRNNCSQAQNFTRSPLVFLGIGPAVHSCCFYALDPRFIL